MTKHAMMYERGGMRKAKKKSIKTTKKRSAVSGQLRAAQRQLWNVLGGVGMVTVILVVLVLFTQWR